MTVKSALSSLYNTLISPAPPTQHLKSNYTFGQILGTGTYGTVYEAHHHPTSTSVAIKVIPKSLLRTSDHSEFHSELAALLRCKDYQHVVGLREYFESKKKYYLVFELARGELWETMCKRGRFSEDEAKEVVRKLVDGVRWLHERGVVHRDLKPENVLFVEDLAWEHDESTGAVSLPTRRWSLKKRLGRRASSQHETASNISKNHASSQRSHSALPTAQAAASCPSRRLVIADFGVAKLLASPTDVTYTVCGSPGYCAPEVLSGQGYTSKVDIWAIGCITFTLLSGRSPFRNMGMTKDEMREEVKRLDVRRLVDGQRWTPEAKIFVMRCMDMDAGRRWDAIAAAESGWLKDSSNSMPLQSNGSPADDNGQHSLTQRAAQRLRRARLIANLNPSSQRVPQQPAKEEPQDSGIDGSLEIESMNKRDGVTIQPVAIPARPAYPRKQRPSLIDSRARHFSAHSQSPSHNSPPTDVSRSTPKPVTLMGLLKSPKGNLVGDSGIEAYGASLPEEKEMKPDKEDLVEMQRPGWMCIFEKP